VLISNISHAQLDCEVGKAILDIKGKNTITTLKLGSNFMPYYQSPIQSEKNLPVITSSSIWLGGKDIVGNIHFAGNSTNPTENDFFPGPVYEDPNKIKCDAWDKIFTVTKEEFEKHLLAYIKYGDLYDCDSIPDGIKYWPGQNNEFINEIFTNEVISGLRLTAEFNDENATSTYDPCQGEYPLFPKNCSLFNKEKIRIPTRLSYFEMNDISGIHKASLGGPIGMQIGIYQWSYDDNVESQDATYYAMKFTNFRETDLKDFFFGLMVDPNMGCPLDDKAGILPSENLVYLYNEGLIDGKGKCNEENSNSYFPYMNAIKFLDLPRAPKVFARDTNGKLIVDANGNKIIVDPVLGTGEIDTLINLNISKFWVNEACKEISNLDCDAITKNPNSYYNIIRGLYKDGRPRLKDGKEINFMYDGLPSDSASWNMLSDKYFESKDIKFGLSFGPMVLQPGAINLIKFVIFQTPVENIPFSLGPTMNNLENLLALDDCFDGSIIKPPKLGFEHQESGIDIEIKRESFIENTVDIVKEETGLFEEKNFDLTSNFEGYILYQLKDGNVTEQELSSLDSSKVKRIYVTDVLNDVDNIYDYLPFSSPVDFNLGRYIWKPILRVNGPNQGINPKLRFDRDLFTGGDLINGKEYFFGSQSYMHNNWKDVDSITGYGQRNQFRPSKIQKHSYVYTSSVNIKEVEKRVSKVDCNNGVLKFINENNATYQVFSIDGKLLANINTQGKQDYLYKLNIPTNTLIVVQELGVEKISAQIVFCY
jgi:hypothetical protein